MSDESPALEPGDAYLEGPYLVFTAQYHLRRGFCCKSNCRHCPYKEGDDGSVEQATELKQEER